jgi:hypothetical protein
LFGGAWEESRVVVENQARAGQPPQLRLQFVLPPYTDSGRVVHDRETIALLVQMLNDEYQSYDFSIKFNYQGKFYRAVLDPTSVNPDAVWTSKFLWVDPDIYRLINQPLRYQLQLRPRPAVGEPLELPEGVVIDLGYSGYDISGTEFNTKQQQICTGPDFVNPAATANPNDPTKPPPPITIMFHPGGSVDRVYGAVNQFGVTLQPLQMIHLLVGRGDKALPLNLRDSNLADTTSLWVTINISTGTVVTGENAGLEVGGNLADNHVRHRIKAREIASSATAMIGN